MSSTVTNISVNRATSFDGGVVAASLDSFFNQNNVKNEYFSVSGRSVPSISYHYIVTKNMEY